MIYGTAHNELCGYCLEAFGTEAHATSCKRMPSGFLVVVDGNISAKVVLGSSRYVYASRSGAKAAIRRMRAKAHRLGIFVFTYYIIGRGQ